MIYSDWSLLWSVLFVEYCICDSPIFSINRNLLSVKWEIINPTHRHFDLGCTVNNFARMKLLRLVIKGKIIKLLKFLD